MGAFRRFGFPLRLAAARLRVGGRRSALVAAGVVAGAAVLAAVLGGRLVMQDRALAQTLAQLPPGERDVQVTWAGDAPPPWRGLDRTIAPRLTALTGAQPARAMLFREASVQGRLVNLRAADDLGRWVQLRSGRLPRACRPSRCEVVRLQGAGPIPSTPYLRLVQVGTGTLRAGAPVTPFIQPPPPTAQVARALQYHTPQPSPLVVANGVVGLSHTRELETFYRSYAWIAPIGGGSVHPWSLGTFEQRLQEQTTALEAGNDLLQVTAPTDALQTANANGAAAARRLLLLGGEGGALLLAFTILAASALRRDVTAARRRLVLHGARGWQVELFTLAESFGLAAIGTVAGWAAGAGAAAVAAAAAGSPAGAVVSHALLSASGLAAAAAVAATAAALLYGTVRASALHLGRLALTPLDVAALAAVAVVAVGWARGSVDASRLANGGTGAFLLLVPGLVVFAASVAAARLLPLALPPLARASARGPLPLRLALSSLARNPGHAAVASTFLVASLGLALFALVYRSTLVRGQSDEAAYAVPASFVLSEDNAQLFPVLHIAPPTAYPGAPKPVLRLTGNVPAGATFTFVAASTTTLAQTGGWRADFASRPLPELASRLATHRDDRLRTLALPPGAHFELPATATGDDVGIEAVFRSPFGDYISVPLGRTRGTRRVVLHGHVPFAHASLARLDLDLLSGLHGSANGGVGIQPSARGTLRLGTPTVNGVAAPGGIARWVGRGGVQAAGDRVSYLLTSVRTGVLRPQQPTDGRLLRVLATPDIAGTAGPGRVIVLRVEGEQVPARVVGLVDRFPSIAGGAVIAALPAASTILDTHSPGLGVTDELWVDVPPARATAAAASLARPPFTRALVASRAETLQRLRDDPLATGASITLAGTAAVALLLALLGFLLGVAGDVRDERGELFDLEAQGARPATLRAHLRLRSLLVGAFGTLGGIALGALLSALVISLVAVTASAAVAEPPLRLSLDLPLAAAGAGVYLAVAVLLIALTTRLGGRVPPRAAETAT